MSFLAVLLAGLSPGGSCSFRIAARPMPDCFPACRKAGRFPATASGDVDRRRDGLALRQEQGAHERFGDCGYHPWAGQLMARRHNGTGRSTGQGRYVALTHWMMRTAAWRSLDTVARCAYVELGARYAGPGSNNGRLPFSLREMAEALNVSKMTAQRALRLLQDRGFIVETKRGAFSLKERHATEWRLTEFGDDVSGALATKDFARWKQNTVSPQDPNGFRDDTARVS